jgi:hypothetical protein
MEREPNLTEALAELKRVILAELEPFLLPIIERLAALLRWIGFK